MQAESQPIPFDEFARHISTIFDDIEAQGSEVVVEREGKLFSLRPRRGRRAPAKPRHLMPNDALLDIIGLGGPGDPNGPTDVSANKHRYLAEAAADLHEPAVGPGESPDQPHGTTGSAATLRATCEETSAGDRDQVKGSREP